MAGPRHRANATPFSDRHRRWLPLWLFVGALLIPAAAGIAWTVRKDVLFEFHAGRLLGALDQRSHAATASHLYAIVRLSRAHLNALLARAVAWPEAHRERIADLILQYKDLRHGASSAYYYQATEPFLLPTPSALSIEPLVDLDRLEQLAPSNEELLRLQAEQLYSEEDYRGCVAKLQKLHANALQHNRTPTPWDYGLWGSALYRLDRFAQAQEQFERAAEMRPRYLPALGPVVRTCARQGQYRRAIAICSRMVILAQNRFVESIPRILLERGQMLGLLERYDLALLDLDAAGALLEKLSIPDPRIDFHLRLCRAQALIAMRRPAGALEELQALHRKEPGHVDILRLRAQALEELGRYEEAIVELREAVLARAKSPHVYNHLAWLLATAKDPDARAPEEALRLARKAAELDGHRSPAILDTLAEACYINRDFEQAVKYETLAVERGGTVYQPSLDRFLEARSRKRAGQPVTLADSPLVDHGKLPRVQTDVPLDLEGMPAAARVPLDAYQSEVQQRTRAGADTGIDVDALARALAQLWANHPRPAIENPKADLRAMALAISQSHWSVPQLVSVRDRLFLLALAHDLPTAGQAGARLPGGPADPMSSIQDPSRADAPQARSRPRITDQAPQTGGRLFAERTVRLLDQELSRAAVGRLLIQLAAGRLRLSECYLPGYYKASLWGMPSISVSQAQDLWPQIEQRIRRAAAGEEIPRLPAKPARTSPHRPGGRRLVPPPGDDKLRIW